MAAWELDFLPSRARASLLVELVLAPEQAASGHADVVEDDLAGVRGPDAHLLELLARAEARGAGRDDEAGLAPGAELGVHRGHDHVDVGDPAVGDPGLGAVDDPLVLGLVVDGPGAQRADVGAGVGLGDAEGGRWSFSGVPKHWGPHSTSCSGVPLAAIPARPRALPKMARVMPASPQASSSLATGRSGRSGRGRLGEEVERVEADPGRLLDDRPGVSSRSSHSWATGRMTSSAKSWTHFWICNWSSLRSRENSDISSPLPLGPSTDPGLSVPAGGGLSVVTQR